MSGGKRFEVYPQHGEVAIDPEVPENTASQPTGEFGWRFQSANGRVNGIGGEGFTREGDAERAIEQLCADLGVTELPPIVRVDE
jgi:hypothetical protein